MSYHVFKSEYSIEEIENNFKDVDLFSGIKEGLEEALAYESQRPAARGCRHEGESPNA